MGRGGEGGRGRGDVGVCEGVEEAVGDPLLEVGGDAAGGLRLGEA